MGSGCMPDEPIDSEELAREIVELERQAAALDHPKALADQGRQAFYLNLAHRLRGLLTDTGAPRDKA